MGGPYQYDHLKLLKALEDLEIDLSILDLFHCNPRRLILSRVDINPRNGTALQLFAALGCQYDHSIFRVDIGRIDDLFYFVLVLFRRGCCLFFGHIDSSRLRCLDFRSLETTKNTVN